jgi:hypothetical protein
MRLRDHDSIPSAGVGVKICAEPPDAQAQTIGSRLLSEEGLVTEGLGETIIIAGMT